jgi:hypothetical protein
MDCYVFDWCSVSPGNVVKEGGMRSIKHWTPYYIVSRIGVMMDQSLNSVDPWLTCDAIRLLE